MASRIRQLVSAEGWYAVFARPSGAAREHTSLGSSRPSGASGTHRAGPVPEFLPLVAWAVVDDAGNEPDQVVGIAVHEDQRPEAVLSDDPSFLGYAGPGDPGIDRTGFTPDWRALAKQAIAELKPQRRRRLRRQLLLRLSSSLSP